MWMRVDVFTYRSSILPYFLILEMSALKKKKKKKVDASDLFFIISFPIPFSCLLLLYIQKNGCSVVSVRGDVGVGMSVWVRESGFRKLPGETQLGHVHTLLSPCTWRGNHGEASLETRAFL